MADERDEPADGLPAPGRSTITGRITQRASDGWTPDWTGAVEAAAQSPSTTLPAAARAQLESRSGHDLSGVQLHTGPEAAAASRALDARAYTLGQSIFLGDTAPAPGSPAGDRLLAHEVAHTIQQRGAAPAAGELRLGGRGDASEVEADRFAARPSPVASGSVAQLTIQRDGGDDHAAAPTGAAADVDLLGRHGDEALDRIQHEWYELHHQALRGDVEAHVASHNAILDILAPLEARHGEVAAAHPGDHELAARVADWERRFASIVNLQTFAGEPLSGAIRSPALVDGSVRAHLRAMAYQIGDVAAARQRVVAATDLDSAVAPVLALQGNRRVFVQHVLEVLPAELLSITLLIPADSAWSALFPGGRGTELATEARAQAAAEDRGIDAAGVGLLDHLVGVARELVAGDRPRVDREYSVFHSLLTTPAERRSFLEMLDAQGLYDPFMLDAPGWLSEPLLADTGYSPPVEGPDVGEAVLDGVRNLPAAILMAGAGMYRQLGGTLDEIGLGFVGQVFTDASTNLTALTREYDQLVGNQDTALRDRIAGATGEIVMAIGEAGVGGEVALAQQGLAVIDGVNDVRVIAADLERFGRWLDEFHEASAFARYSAAILEEMTRAVTAAIRGDFSDPAAVEAYLAELAGRSVIHVSDVAGWRFGAERDQAAADRAEHGRADERRRVDAGEVRREIDQISRSTERALLDSTSPDPAVQQRAWEQIQANQRQADELRTRLAFGREDPDAATPQPQPAGDGRSFLDETEAALLSVVRKAFEQLVEQGVRELVRWAQSGFVGSPRVGAVAKATVRTFLDGLWDEITEPVIDQLAEWIGELLDHVGPGAGEIGEIIISEALEELIGGAGKEWFLTRVVDPVLDEGSAAIQEWVDARVGELRGAAAADES